MNKINNSHIKRSSSKKSSDNNKSYCFNKNNTFIDYLITFFKGLFMGAADIVPGVSGGTIALIVGIYERFINAISSVFDILNKQFFRNLFNFKIRKLIRQIKKIDFGLLVPLGLGILTSILSMAHLMDYLLNNYKVITYCFFGGLILSSIGLIGKKVKLLRFKNVLSLILGFIVGFFIVSLNTLSANNALPIIFVSGAIAICAMILPGISGAFLLVILNQYEYILHSVKSLNFFVIIVFMLGAFFGLMLFSRFIKYMLKKYHSISLSFLTGLMAGSLKMQYDYIMSDSSISYLKISFFILLGIVIVLIIHYLGNKVERKK
jgi:putative membrane protein